MKEGFRIEEELKESVPHSGHRDRFLKKLESGSNSTVQPIRNRRIFTAVISAAAVLAITFTILQFGNNDDHSEIILQELSPKLQMTEHTDQLELIYTQHVSPQLPKIIEHLPELETQIKLLEILENEYSKLKELLLTSGGNPAVTQEMIRNHKLRLSLMEQLVTQIKISNQVKNQNNEISI